MLYSQVIIIRFKQCANILSKKNMKNNSAVEKTNFFCKWFVSTLKIFSKFNKCHGKVFLVYLLINCPVNVFLLLYFLMKDLSKLNQSFIVALFSAQLVGLFLVHYMLARINWIIHRAPRPIHTLVINRRVTYLKDVKLKIAHANFWMSFQTNKHYGPTYGSFGHVTMNTLFKYIFLYGNLCMKIRKMF